MNFRVKIFLIYIIIVVAFKGTHFDKQIVVYVLICNLYGNNYSFKFFVLSL